MSMKAQNLIPLHRPNNRNTYSPEAQQATRIGLESLQAQLFMHKHRCHLKNADFEGKRAFGYLTIENALAGHLLVEDADGGAARLYATVDDLVNDGWVVD